MIRSKYINAIKDGRRSYSTQYGIMAIGDSRKLVQILPDNYIDAIITSPPYYNLKDYKHKNQIGNGQKYDEFFKDIVNIFQQCYRICKNTGSLWIVINTIRINNKTVLLPFQMINALEKINWYLHDIIIWHKDRTIPWYQNGHFRKAFEYILFFTKTVKFMFNKDRLREKTDIRKWWIKYPERYHPKGKLVTDVWNIPLQNQGAWGGKDFPRHFCPFPFELVERILSLVSNPKQSIIFDPFAGTGSVLAQANAMKRYFIGFDINKRFLSEFRKKTMPAALRREQCKTQIKNNGSFNNIIILLRVLKYCSIFLKEYRNLVIEKKGNAKTPYCAFVYFNEKQINNKDVPLQIIMFFLWTKSPKPSVKKNAIKLCYVRPLNTFGIMSEIIHTVHVKQLKKFIEKKHISKLYIYVVGNTHKYKKIILQSDISELLKAKENIELKNLPIISNVKLYVDEE